MTLISRLVSRVLGPAGLLLLLGAGLAPLTAQRSIRVDAAPFQLADERLGSTVGLMLPAILLGTALWLPIALLVGHRRGPAGLVVAPGTILAQALAPFLTGLILVVWLGVGAGLFPVTGGGTAAHLVLPSLTLAIMLVGVLSHATYLRATKRQVAEAAGIASDDDSPLLDLADDWLDTLSRYAGAFVGALVVVEVIFGLPGVGRVLVSTVANRDHPVMGAAIFRLVEFSVVMTAIFGIGAAFTGRLLDRRLTSAGTRAATLDGVITQAGKRVQFPSRLLAIVALTVGGLLLLGLVVMMVTPVADPLAQSMQVRLAAPGQQDHLLGTDPLGRDLAARIAYSLRSALLLAIPATLSAAVAGILFGLLAAAFRIGDLLISAVVDTVQTVPALVFGLFVASTIGPGPATLGIVLPIVTMFVLARLTRDAALASWAGGQRRIRPAVGAVLLALCIGLSGAILLETTLSFLGVGVTPPIPALGEMLSSGRQYLGTAPWLMIPPGLVLTALIGSLLLLGYGAFGVLRPGRPAAVRVTRQTGQPVPA